MDAFWRAVARPALQARAQKAFELGLQQRTDIELRLGEYVEQLGSTDPVADGHRSFAYSALAC